MTYVPKLTSNGDEWDVNPALGLREIEIEIEYEYPCGTMSPCTSIGYVFLSREDLTAMLAALDEETP